MEGKKGMHICKISISETLEDSHDARLMGTILFGGSMMTTTVMTIAQSRVYASLEKPSACSN